MQDKRKASGSYLRLLRLSLNSFVSALSLIPLASFWEHSFQFMISLASFLEQLSPRCAITHLRVVRLHVVLNFLTCYSQFLIGTSTKSTTALAKFLWSFRNIVEVFVASGKCWDLFGPARMLSGTFGYVWKPSEAFGRFWNFCDIFAVVAKINEKIKMKNEK